MNKYFFGYLLLSITIFTIYSRPSGPSKKGNNSAMPVPDPQSSDSTNQNPVIPLTPAITNDPQYKKLVTWVKNNPKMTALISTGVITVAGIISLMIEAAVNKQDSIAVKMGDTIKKVGIDMNMIPDSFKLTKLKQKKEILEQLNKLTYNENSNEQILNKVGINGYMADLLSWRDSVMLPITKSPERIAQLKKMRKQN